MVSRGVNGVNVYSLTGSPESVRNLTRYRGPIKGNMAAIDGRPSTSITDGIKQFVAKSTRADITEIEVRIMQILAVDSHQQIEGTELSPKQS